MGVVIGVVIAFLVYQSGALATLFPSLGTGFSAPRGIIQPPSSTVAQNLATTQALTSASIQAGSASAVFGLQQAGASSSAIAAVPVIGAVVSAIAGVLIAASKKRAAEATNENTAVANGLPGWDQAVAQIVGAYNNGSINAAGVATLLETALTNFWNEVRLQIQPGRNGCNSGANCPPVTGTVSANNTNEGGNNYCSGSIGAACCVGCADLNLSTSNMIYAANAAQNGNKPVSAFVQTVYASKYGGVNRPAYTVTFTPYISGVPQ